MIYPPKNTLITVQCDLHSVHCFLFAVHDNDTIDAKTQELYEVQKTRRGSVWLKKTAFVVS